MRKLYALKHKVDGCLMSVNVVDLNENALAKKYEWQLIKECEDSPIWMVKDRSIAEKVALKSSPWCNSNYFNPNNIFLGCLEVVEVNLSF